MGVIIFAIVFMGVGVWALRAKYDDATEREKEQYRRKRMNHRMPWE